MKKSAFIITSFVFLLLGIIGNFRTHLLPAIDINSTPLDIQTQYDTKNVQIDDITVTKKWELDFLVDRKIIGDSVKINIGPADFTVPLVKRYGVANKYLLPLLLFLGITFWAIGCYIFRAKPQDWAARIFYAASMIAAITVQSVWPGCPQPGDFVGLFFVILYWFCYALIPAFIMYFTLLYPAPKRVLMLHKRLPLLLFTPGFLLIVALEVTYLPAVLTRDISVYRSFYNIYNYGFRSYLIIYLALSIFHLIHSYFHATTKENRQKVQWIIWGLVFGISPFLFLWTLPQQLGFPAFIPEIGIYIFMTLLPISIAISIIKYQAMDINFIIEKSIIYIITALALLVVFLLFVAFTDLDLREVLNSYRLQFNFGIIFLALLLSPLLSQKILTGIQVYFKGEYDFPQIIKTYGTATSSLHTRAQVSKFYVEKLLNILPVNNIAFFIHKESLNVADSCGFSKEKLQHLENAVNSIDQTEFLESPERSHFRQTNEPRIPEIYKNAIVKLLLLPVYITRKIWLFLFVQPIRTIVSTTQSLYLKGTDILIVPSITSDQLIGVTMLGTKNSGEEFSIEEIELTNQMAIETFKALERIELQEAMVFEQAEKEKLEELNQLKSEFISLVSHELRSPLTSIRWSVENLLDGIPEKPGPKTEEYLKGIHASSKHLTHMIENLLDLSKIEAGKIEFFPEKLILTEQMNNAIEPIKPLAFQKKITIKNEIADFWVNADRNLLREIYTNLLENAIKYSDTGKTISVKSKIDSNVVSVSVIDQGFGIAEEKLPFIFEKFSRMHQKPDAEKGLGLGLHIVKKMVELQSGSISVSSKVGEGSTFILTLPGGQMGKAIQQER